ncbi:hypothetical protein AB0302_04495 [Micrococcus sp. NPDC078436]|uniref:hypothetical protein n=1 Tax=Micrococcus sp. NPDC078436 TaxID=3154960 RepID=UPI00344DEEF2
MQLMTETCQLVLRATPTGEYDDYGLPIIGGPETITVPCWYEPRGSSEETTAAEQQIDGYWIYLPLDTDLEAADAVRLAGHEYQVVGEPGRQPGGFITPGFIRAALERVRG